MGKLSLARIRCCDSHNTGLTSYTICLVQHQKVPETAAKTRFPARIVKVRLCSQPYGLQTLYCIFPIFCLICRTGSKEAISEQRTLLQFSLNKGNSSWKIREH